MNSKEAKEVLELAALHIAEAKEHIKRSEELMERFKKDDFPHTPLMVLYKRPPIPPNYC